MHRAQGTGHRQPNRIKLQTYAVNWLTSSTGQRAPKRHSQANARMCVCVIVCRLPGQVCTIAIVALKHRHLCEWREGKKKEWGQTGHAIGKIENSLSKCEWKSFTQAKVQLLWQLWLQCYLYLCLSVVVWACMCVCVCWLCLWPWQFVEVVHTRWSKTRLTCNITRTLRWHMQMWSSFNIVFMIFYAAD